MGNWCCKDTFEDWRVNIKRNTLRNLRDDIRRVEDLTGLEGVNFHPTALRIGSALEEKLNRAKDEYLLAIAKRFGVAPESQPRPRLQWSYLQSLEPLDPMESDVEDAHGLQPIEEHLPVQITEVPPILSVLPELPVSSVLPAQVSHLTQPSEPLSVELESKLESDSNSSWKPVCITCQSSTPEVICIPCGHACLCLTCIRKLQQSQCPICRGASTFARVYL
jgi:hypothetical protein